MDNHQRRRPAMADPHSQIKSIASFGNAEIAPHLQRALDVLASR